MVFFLGGAILIFKNNIVFIKTAWIRHVQDIYLERLKLKKATLSRIDLKHFALYFMCNSVYCGPKYSATIHACYKSHYKHANVSDWLFYGAFVL